MYCLTAKEVKQYLYGNNTSIMSLDTETTGLDYYTLEAEAISLYNGKFGCYIDLVNTQEKQEIIDILKRYLSNPDLILICHNLVFDMQVLYRLGITELTTKVFCTMIASFLLDENRPCGLKYLTGQLLNREPMHYEQVQRFRRNSPEFIQYAIDDAINCFDLQQIFKEQLREQNLNYLFYKIEMPFQFVLRDMKVNGIKADLLNLPKYQKLCEEKIVDLECQLYELAGIEYRVNTDLLGNKIVNGPINFGSSDDLVTIVEKKLGLKITTMTKPSSKYPKGQKSMGKESRQKLKGKHPFIDVLDKYSKLTKLYSAFILPFKDHVDGDGRIRCNFNGTVAVTGRLSCSKPNLQQCPRDSSEFDFNFRELFISEEGKSLIVSDFGGQELRILADLSKDENMIKAFSENIDMHLMLGNEMLKLGIPKELLHETHPDYKETKSKYKEARHKAKNGVNFPIIYGTTPYGVSKNLGVTEAEAQHYIDTFFKVFPNVKKSMIKCFRHLRGYKYVYSKTGRRRRFDYIDDRTKRQAFNFLIQGTAADMLKASMILVSKVFKKHPEWGAKIVLTVHDEIVVEVKDKYVDICKQAVEWAMLNAYKLSVPLVCETGVGKNYADAK